jgi:hypothetical protein
MGQDKSDTYMVGISKRHGASCALFKCNGLVNAVNATTVLSRCFPENPEIARFWLAGRDEQTYLPDDKKLGLTRDELAEVLRATYTVAERGYI